jgi:hypothetical protein
MITPIDISEHKKLETKLNKIVELLSEHNIHYICFKYLDICILIMEAKRIEQTYIIYNLL